MNSLHFLEASSSILLQKVLTFSEDHAVSTWRGAQFRACSISLVRFFPTPMSSSRVRVISLDTITSVLKSLHHRCWATDHLAAGNVAHAGFSVAFRWLNVSAKPPRGGRDLREKHQAFGVTQV